MYLEITFSITDNEILNGETYGYTGYFNDFVEAQRFINENKEVGNVIHTTSYTRTNNRPHCYR